MVRDDVEDGLASRRLDRPVLEGPGLAHQEADLAGGDGALASNLKHERPGRGHVGQREVDAGELYLGPTANWGIGKGSQQGPQALGPDQLVTRGRDILPVHGDAGMHGADQRRRVALTSIPARRKTARAWPRTSP